MVFRHLARGTNEALDFAATSGMRADQLQHVVQDTNFTFQHYEGVKRQYLDRGKLCTDAGFQCTPLILEAHSGGWSATGRRVLDFIAKAAAAAENESESVTSLRIAQRISVALHKENARAVLKRSVPGVSAPQPASWEEGGGLDDNE